MGQRQSRSCDYMLIDPSSESPCNYGMNATTDTNLHDRSRTRTRTRTRPARLSAVSERRTMGSLAIRIAAVFVGLWRHQASECEICAGLVDKNVVFGHREGAISTSCAEQVEVDEEDHEEEEESIIRDNCTCKRTSYDVLGFVYSTCVFSGHMLDAVYGLHLLWGQQEYLLSLLSYNCYLFQLLLVSGFSFVTHAVTLVKTSSCKTDRVIGFLGRRAIRKRVVVLQRSRKNEFVLRARTYSCFLAAPVVCAVLRVLSSIVAFPPECHDWFIYTVDWMAALGLLMYGSFWYIVCVYRVSIQRQLKVILRRIRWLAVLGDPDGSRHLVRAVYADYFALREMMGYWVAVTMVTVTWGIMTRLTWDYTANVDRAPYIYFDTMVWFEYITFLITPFVALGGLNLGYIWDEFRHDIVTSHVEPNRAFWKDITKYVQKIDKTGHAELKLTLAFTFIGLYCSMQMETTSESIQLWGLRYLCNSTDI